MRKLVLPVIVICILFVASFAYADPIAGRWSSMSPCINDLQVSNNHTFYMWQACNDGDCWDITEYSGMWQKVSKDVYELLTGSTGDILILKGSIAIGQNGATLLKNTSVDSLKPNLYQYMCQ